MMSSKPRILLVEDDEIAAIVAGEILSSEYDVKHVACGQAALDTLSRELPDLVLLDVDMPDMSGFEVCRAIRATFGNLPVIFLSGTASEAEIQAGYDAGGNDYMTKPISMNELCSRVKLQLQSIQQF